MQLSSPTVPKKCTMFTLHSSPDITNPRLWSSEGCRLVWMGKQLRAQWEMNYWGHFGISTCRGQYVLAVNHTFNIAGFQKHAEKKKWRPTIELFFQSIPVVGGYRCIAMWLQMCSDWFLSRCYVVAMMLGVVAKVLLCGCKGVLSAF